MKRALVCMVALAALARQAGCQVEPLQAAAAPTLEASLPAVQATASATTPAPFSPASTHTSLPTRPLKTQSPAPRTQVPSATSAVEPTLAPADCPKVCFFPLPSSLGRPAEIDIDWSYPFGALAEGARKPHAGVEFPMTSGTPVTAVADGQVWWAGNDRGYRIGQYLGQFGNVVLLEHQPEQGPRLYTVYAHLSEVSVAEGEQVWAGQQLGLSGSSGLATGPHLHFEVRVDGSGVDAARNPLLFIRALNPLTHGALAGSIISPGGLQLRNLAVVLRRMPSADGEEIQQFNTTTYGAGVASHPDWQENFILEDLPPGNYQLSLITNGRLYKRDIPVEPGKLTYTNIHLGE